MAQTMVTAGTFPESPIVERPLLRWPGGARVAVSVLLPLEHVEWLPPRTSVVPNSVVHRPPYPEIPDVHEVSPHEYGNRVGIFRLGRLLDELGVPATVAIDVQLATHRPSLVEYCRSLGWEIAAHGLSGSRAISEAMSEDEERAYVETSIQAVERATGERPRGWSSVGYQESTRTTRILASHGIRYVVDWPNDEQPYWMSTADGHLVSLPVTIHSDDVYAQRIRRIPVQRWEQVTREAFDRLSQDGAATGRTMLIALNPWMSGQPFRMRYVRSVLEHLLAADGAWLATCGQVVDAFMGQQPPASNHMT